MRQLDYIAHHGILGMKWGIRRYQNKDGTLTEAGKRHYHPNYLDRQRRQDKALYGQRGVERINKRMYQGYSILGARHYEAARKERKRKIAEGAAAVAGLGASAFGVMYGVSPEFRNTVNQGVMAAGKYASKKIYQAKNVINNVNARGKAARNFRKWGMG
jgi:hypothetical protein